MTQRKKAFSHPGATTVDRIDHLLGLHTLAAPNSKMPGVPPRTLLPEQPATCTASPTFSLIRRVVEPDTTEALYTDLLAYTTANKQSFATLAKRAHIECILPDALKATVLSHTYINRQLGGMAIDDQLAIGEQLLESETTTGSIIHATAGNSMFVRHNTEARYFITLQEPDLRHELLRHRKRLYKILGQECPKLRATVIRLPLLRFVGGPVYASMGAITHMDKIVSNHLPPGTPLAFGVGEIEKLPRDEPDCTTIHLPRYGTRAPQTLAT